MTVSVTEPEVEHKGRQQPCPTGENTSAPVTLAIRERLQRVAGTVDSVGELIAKSERCAVLPGCDDRPDEQISRC